MRRVAWIALGLVIPIIVSLFVQTDCVLAGPPLLCHAIEIGAAESLPWGESVWSNDAIAMDDESFVARTLELLSSDAAILTRMETIRRATIHAAERPKAAASLMAALRNRVSLSSKSSTPDPLALFDLGYLITAFSQMNIVTEHNSKGTDGRNRHTLAIPGNLSAYELVTMASELSKNPADAQFALALITMSPENPAHKRHLQNAVSGAEDGSLLALNLVRRFGGRHGTLADLRASIGMVGGDGERR